MAGALALDVHAGEAVVSLGTSGTAYTLADQQSHEPTGTVCGFADATGRFLPLVCTLNCARNLDATAAMLGVDLAELSRLAMSAPRGAEGITFMPYLEGERTPPLPHATGELLGLTRANMKPANVARAAIESVLWSLAYGIEVLAEQTGRIERVTLTGGAAQSEAVQQIAAAVFGLPITVTEPFESVAVGAARQAAWALTGEFPEWTVPVVREIQPTAEDLAAHHTIADRYRRLLHEHYNPA
jgi:xylulokinase